MFLVPLSLSVPVFNASFLSKLFISGILGVSVITSSSIIISNSNQISQKIGIIWSPVKDAFMKSIKPFTTLYNPLKQGSTKIFEKYRDWGLKAKDKTSSLSEKFQSFNSDNLVKGGKSIFNSWSQWYSYKDGVYSPIKEAVEKIFLYISDWNKIKEIIKMIPMFLMMLATAFSYISALFNKKVLKQENQKKEELEKAQKLEKAIEQLQKMAQNKNSKTVWQSLWTLISENTSVLPTVKFEHISEIFDMSTTKTEYFQKRIELLKKGTRKYLKYNWGNYETSQNLINALKEERMSEFLRDIAFIGIDAVSSCRDDQKCNQEEKINDFVGLVMNLEEKNAKKIMDAASTTATAIFGALGLGDFW